MNTTKTLLNTENIKDFIGKEISWSCACGTGNSPCPYGGKAIINGIRKELSFDGKVTGREVLDCEILSGDDLSSSSLDKISGYFTLGDDDRVVTIIL